MIAIGSTTYMLLAEQLMGTDTSSVSRTLQGCLSVSVREVHAALQSLRTIRRIEARRRKARAFRFRFSQSLAKRRQRLSQPIVLSTIQRFGRTTKPLAASERLTISSLTRRRTRFSAFWNFAPW